MRRLALAALLLLPGCAALNVAKESAYAGVGGGLGAFFGPVPAFLGAFFMDLLQQAVRGAEVQEEAAQAVVQAAVESAHWAFPDSPVKLAMWAFIVWQIPDGRKGMMRVIGWAFGFLKKDKPTPPEDDPDPPAYGGPGDTVPKQ